MKKVTILKLGGSVITDKSKPYTPNISVIKRLAGDIKESGESVLIIHGQGSFAHTSAKKFGGKKGYKSLSGIATVFGDAMKMNSIVMDELLKSGLPVVSFRPNSIFLAKDGKMQSHNMQSILKAFEQGMIPVLYGDVIIDSTNKTTIFSGETIAKYLVDFLTEHNVKVERIIQVGVTDGVYGQNNKTINEITASNYKIVKGHFFESKNTDVTGGMQHKVENALEIAKTGVPTFVINGTIEKRLLKALRGVYSFSTKIV